MANIKNRDRYPDADWVSDDQVRKIGDIGGIPLVLLGFEVGFEPDEKMPIVARSQSSDPLTEELFATPLYQLFSLQDPVTVTEQFS